VLHTHQPHITALTCLEDQTVEFCSQHALRFPGRIAYLNSYGMATEASIGTLIRDAMQEKEILLMANHGAVAYGEDLWQSFDRLETLEHTAKIAILAIALGGANDLPQDAIEKLIQIREKAGYLKENARCQACGYLHDAKISCELDVSYPAQSGSNGGKISFTREELIELLSQAAKLS
jgi:L-fuculose-phosphate aldolase